MPGPRKSGVCVSDTLPCPPYKVTDFNAITTMAAKAIQKLMIWHLAVLKVDASHQFGSAEDDATVHLVFSDGPHAVLTLQQLGSFRPVF